MTAPLPPVPALPAPPEPPVPPDPAGPAGSAPATGPGAPAYSASSYDEDGATMQLYVPDGAEHLGGGAPDVTPGPRRSRRRDDVRRPPDGRRRPVAVAGVAAAVVAVIGTVAFAGGLFDADGDDSADRVAPVPSLSADQWPVDGSGSPSPEDGSATPSPSASAREDADTSPSASASASGAAGESASAEPSAAPEAPAPARPDPVQETSATPRTEAPPTADGPSLSRGDRGQAVSELKHRLREAGVYDGPMHDRYDASVEAAVARYQTARAITGDPRGVYGPTTRAALEAETAGRQ
ncbi:peptidoglycan-binding protein [Streptomyces sp. MUM 203J]|uniref:peptidoglycan-binding domain-containing protein n=1 Tax=Streptomyces sp. MUM 203J TaxID=2791990 RepID=UPI001F04DD64|nr:peptidoglycan-binding domain-containing protein [Streptomyces sp. MUM 203J]MCH0539018.1 peptidoglycan-binding protein [Streptomyces sp. MUM 203J]